MKKVGIISSVLIITGVFIYSMSFVSGQNTCTGVRMYECTALEKQKAAEALAQQQAVQLLVQQQTNAAKIAAQQALAAQQQVVLQNPIVTQKPVVQQPVVQKPVIQKPVVQQPVVQQPNTVTRAS